MRGKGAKLTLYYVSRACWGSLLLVSGQHQGWRWWLWWCIAVCVLLLRTSHSSRRLHCCRRALACLPAVLASTYCLPSCCFYVTLPAALAAAVADLEAQAAEEAARDASLAPPGLPAAGHVPALMGPAVLMGGAIRPPGYHPPAGEGTQYSHSVIKHSPQEQFSKTVLKNCPQKHSSKTLLKTVRRQSVNLVSSAACSLEFAGGGGCICKHVTMHRTHVLQCTA